MSAMMTGGRTDGQVRRDDGCSPRILVQKGREYTAGARHAAAKTRQGDRGLTPARRSFAIKMPP
ncbi:hypothetical protein DIE11_03300 [Burkholderia sp. Bp9012]|nr:hypothetical protein DIE11_03300 [Burkholderia sp. Bp9012]